MLRTYVIVTAAVLAFAPMAYAQSETQQSEPPEAIAAPEPQAIPRSEAPQSTAPAQRSAPTRSAEPVRSRAAEAPAASADDQGRAVPRGGRPRGDNPPVGTAVPREQGRRDPGPVTRNGGENRNDRDRNGGQYRGGGRTIYAGPGVYNNYYDYPRRSYPYGYGAFGLGYFYYDPYAWYPDTYSAYGGYGYGGYGYGGSGYPGYYPGRAYSEFDTGYLRLRVSPRQAQVFVDGYFAGEVDDYDGIVQGLRLESGTYHIEIVAPGYETLEFDVRIIPGQKINYRGDLRPRP